jgi:type IV fimbrial biogenesis protein FimT
MLIGASRQRGVTMMEIMVTVAIIAVAMAVGIPNLSSWAQSAQIKSTAETILTGLQMARGEAVRQNNQVQFIFLMDPDNDGSAGWQIISASSSVPGSFLLSDGAIVAQSAAAAEMGENARLNFASSPQGSPCCTSPLTAPIAGNENVVFDAFGKVLNQTITRIDVVKSGDTDTTDEQKSRRRVILISSSGSPKLCRPALAASNPQGCP